MAASQLERLAPLTGVAAVVLTFVAGIVASGPDFADPAEEVVSYFVEDTDQIFAGVIIGGVGSFLLLWFVGTVRAALAAAEGAQGRVASIAFGGGVAAATALVASWAVLGTGAVRADEDAAIGPDGAVTLFDLANMLFAVAAPIGMSVLIAATSVVALRTDSVLPGWLAWVSLLLAAGLLVSPIAWAFTLGFAAWTIVVSLLLYVKVGNAGAALTE